MSYCFVSIVRTCVAVALLAISSISFAGVYASADLGYADPDSDKVRASSAISFDLGIGTEVTPWLAFEMNYVGLGDFSVSGAPSLDDADVDSVALGVASDFDIRAWAFSTLLSWRPNKWDNFYARLGYMNWENELSVNVRSGNFYTERRFYIDGSDPLFGLGYAYKLGGGMFSSIEYNRYFAGDVTVDILAVGLNYQF